MPYEDNIEKRAKVITGAVGTDIAKTTSKKKDEVKYTPRLTQDGMSSSPYWKKPFNPFSALPNCTTYAWGRFGEIMGGTKPQLPTGDAGTWYPAAVKSGIYKTGQTPELGAVWCGAGGPWSGLGHVAIVEQINSDGSFVLSMSGWHARYFWTETRTKNNYGGAYRFQGFIYNPMGGGSVSSGVEGGDTIDMKERIAKLFSSDNYAYLDEQKLTDARINDRRNSFFKTKAGKAYKFYEQQYRDLRNLSKAKFDDNKFNLSAVVDEALGMAFDQLVEKAYEEVRKTHKTNNKLNINNLAVEAPYVTLSIGGYTIGTYGGSDDKYPNHIESMQISKTNGQINLYTINVIHQIRFGEDPNVIDKIIASNKFRPIGIVYGDSTSQQEFRDTRAIITNVKSSKDYAGKKISYTIYATSAGQLVTSYITNFPAIKDKPSNVIRNLFYGNGTVSTLLQDAFPGMKDARLVEKYGLIPTNDTELNIEAQQGKNPIEYINYLVANMSNQVDNKVLKDSLYYISYRDDTENKLGGSYVQINEVQRKTEQIKYDGKSANIYEVTVGYPDDSLVMDFQINSSICWGLLYDKASKGADIGTVSEYSYSVDNQGNVTRDYSAPLLSTTDTMNEISQNWWTHQVNFPIQAKLTIKGLLKPIMLTDYIKVDVKFYGQTHIASGIYTITSQTDTLSSSGFRTTLGLTRIGGR